MAFVGNLLWFIFGGFLAGTLWMLVGLLLCATIGGIPLGMACFTIGRFAYFPFGKALCRAEMLGEKRIVGTGLMNFIWCMFFGWWLSLTFALLGIWHFCFFWLVTPLIWGKACFNIAQACFAPLGQCVVDRDVAAEARKRWISAQLDKKLGTAAK